MFVPNGKGFWDNIKIAQDTTKADQEEQWISRGFTFPVCLPIKMHSRGVALQCRAGKVKARGTGNLSVHGDFEAHSTNAGWDWLNEWDFPNLQYATASLFAADVGATRYAFSVSDFEIRKNDWASFYRQLWHHPELLWTQVAMTQAEGITMDYRLIFGDSRCPLAANRVENLFLWLIRWYMMEAWGLGDDPSQWRRKLLTCDWAQHAEAQEWLEGRINFFPDETCTSWEALSVEEAVAVMEDFWN